ncbi:MAG: TonB-dependent receptor [Novosphingobium sp.]
MGARIAFYRNEQKGYFRNGYKGPTSVTPTPTQIAIFGPLPPVIFSRAPDLTDTGVRATLKYEPSDALTIRLKGAYFRHSGAESALSAQLFYCPAGGPSPLNIGNVPGAGECNVDTTTAAIGKSVDSVIGEDPRFGNGDPVETLTQYLGQLDASYNFDDRITVDSVTGYYRHHYLSVGIPGISLYPTAAALDDVRRDQFSQELRVRTTLDAPLNAMIGVYYQSGDFATEVPLTILNSTTLLPSNDYYFDSRTYSAFGQLTYQAFGDKVEVSAGARYTDEKKSQRVFSRALNAFVMDLPETELRSRRLLPEVSLSWHPNREINVFATWKKGAKSGGFNSDILAAPPYSGFKNRYNDEKASGFEGGVKSVLFDGALRFDVTAYSYTYKDLQVSVFDSSTNSSATRNAATAKTRGVQISSNFAPRSLPGFNLSASVDYTHARYGTYLAQCYTGQTISAGCNLDAFGNVVTTGAVNQNLDGTPTTVAPNWSGSLTGAYDFPIGSDTRLGLSVGAAYTGRYNPLSSQVPQAVQRSSVNINAQVRLFDDDGWELALIGKNLTNTLRVKWGLETPFTPGLGVDAGTGTATGIQSDLFGYVNAPRQVMLRLTIKPFGLLNRN